MYKDRLKLIREENNIKQKKIAEILKIAYSSYRVYEVEKNIIPIKYLNDISNYFNVSIDYLFDLTNVKQHNNSKKDIDIKISSRRLYEFRKNKKYTQHKLASILNVDQTTISSYEKGKNIISTTFLYAICKTFNTSADYLLGKIDIG